MKHDFDDVIHKWNDDESSNYLAGLESGRWGDINLQAYGSILRLTNPLIYAQIDLNDIRSCNEVIWYKLHILKVLECFVQLVVPIGIKLNPDIVI